ncbi:phytase [Pseudomonas sp. 148P]|uniref:Phytase n=1 Tax=Pseudomonas ulcerans TaxID=3115852 RepID=A0ABU7HUF4_9PSED|nr:MULTISPECIES: phytase [unclassified Pseudomonas]MEE1924072.1 phytase [Pseudomonas sp. 147P]MEE1935165.1 phytase [Pseudomonas sp. 148P]
MFKARPYPLLGGLLLSLAVSQAVAQPALTLGERLPGALENARLLGNDGFWPGAERLLAGKQGLQLLKADGQVLSQLEGRYKGLDLRTSGDGLLVASLDSKRQQALLVGLQREKGWSTPLYLPKRDFAIEGLCLYRDSARNSFLFLVGDEGVGEQWLVASADVPLASAQRVRGLSLPPMSEHCQVDDASDSLYVNEENVGLWRYGAAAEAPLQRRPVDLRAPFGALGKKTAGMAVVPGGLLALDPASATLHLYRQQGLRWQGDAALALAGLKDPEQVSLRQDGKGLDLLIVDDQGQQRARLDWQLPAVATPPATPVLPALVQTEPVPSFGDAADDPAIWVNAADPQHSRVLGTDKKGGLLVYDLAGKPLQDLRIGRVNNVDVRNGFRLGERSVDLAVASNRDHNSLHVFSIEPKTGEVAVLGEVPTPLKDIYGLCLFKDATGAIHAIANDKDGSFLQYRLDAPRGEIQGELVRRFATATQPEGCVADDRGQRLFIGEEDKAVWALDARADAPATLEQVIAVGGPVKADIEGLGFYPGKQRDYLVISSQGNDRYVVVEAKPPYRLRGSFSIGLNAERGIDGASETDGLDLTSANLGRPWSQGLLVVQDGRKRMPEGTQNFKYLAWSQVVEALKLD